MKFRIASLVLLAALPLAVGACEDSVAGVSGDEAEFAVVFAPESGTAALSGDLALSVGPEGPSPARISLSSVESIVLPIGAVEARTADSTNAQWIEAGAIDADIDLLDLPDDGIELVDGALPQGQYDALRFWLTAEASITLAETVQVGRTTFEAGTYPLEIPSADNAGVRLRADFQVTEEGQVLTVLVDGDATIRGVMATGAGVLKIAPVLNVQNRDGQHVGGMDGGERHGEHGIEAEGFVTSVSDNGFVIDDSITVQVTDSTELAGDFLALDDVADALAAGDTVEAEVRGERDSETGAIVAHRVEFETDDDDGDGEVDDSDDGEVEVRGRITGIDGGAMTFTLMHQMETITVTIDGQTVLDFDDGYESWDDVVEAVEAGDEVRAEAEGEWTGTGQLLAWEVDFGAMHGGGGGGMGGM